MTIPKYNELYNDVLNFLADKKEYHTKYVKETISDNLNLTANERNELIPSKKEKLIENRLSWTITYLKKAGLVESRKKGYVNITEIGLNEFSKNIIINDDYLLKYDSFKEFVGTKHKYRKSSLNTVSPKKYALDNFTPEEEIEKAFNLINNQLADELIDNILNKNHYFFEKLVIDLLLKMGYDDFHSNSGIRTSSNDEGIEGIINQDKLGLDKIAIQAKRFNKYQKIDMSLIQNFAGAMLGKGLNKGIFITTSSFRDNAYNYVDNQNFNIVLIDGEKLAKLMIEYGVGTFTTHTYPIKQIDSDYFNLGE